MEPKWTMEPKWVKDFVIETEEGQWEAFDETQANSLGIYPTREEAVRMVIAYAKYLEYERNREL